MVRGTPVQLRTFPATQRSETGRVFIQDSSSSRLLQHYLWGFHGQPLQGKGSLCSSGWGEQYSLAGLSSSQASGQPGSTWGVDYPGEKQASQALLLSGCSQPLEWPFGHDAARTYRIWFGSWSDPWQSIRFGRSWKWSTAHFPWTSSLK